MKASWLKYLFIFSFSLVVIDASGQIDSGLKQDSTLLDNEEYFADSTLKNEKGFFTMFEGDPGRAALYSLIIPSAGQVYNKRWLKVPIVLGIEGTAIGFIVYYKNLHSEVDLAFKGLVRGEISQYRGITDPAGLRRIRDSLKKNRDYSIIALTLAHILNVADAFVDRHLMEFDVEEDISFRFGPTTHGVGLAFRF